MKLNSKSQSKNDRLYIKQSYLKRTFYKGIIKVTKFISNGTTYIHDLKELLIVNDIAQPNDT